ncbi:MAG: hypothetical protein GF390_02885 [Candidatus Pacebacteria bacterium]|nr:hypothetical protein [Candidatus Paceibacterota bacterium]
MYDQLFTSAWVFDRCQEGAKLLNIPTLIILCIVFGLVLYYFLNKKLKLKAPTSLTISVLVSLLLLFLSFPAIIMVGYGVFDCAAYRRYWPLIEPAKELNGKLNHLHTYSMSLPKNEDELRDMFPELYNSTLQTSKIKYHYDDSENRYILAIRASKYNLQIFDSEKGLINYRLGWASFFYDNVPKFEDQSEYGVSVMPN